MGGSPGEERPEGLEGLDELELDLLPVYFLDQAPSRRPRPPIPEAMRLLAPPASAWDCLQPRVRHCDQLWIDPSSPPKRPWSEGAVRRILDLPYPFALAALDAVFDDGPETVLRDGSASLALATRLTRATAGECWIPGDLHVHRRARPVRVELVLEPWSRHRTDLRLQARCHRGTVRLPRHYYDAAHDVIDALRRAIADGPIGLATRFGARAAC